MARSFFVCLAMARRTRRKRKTASRRGSPQSAWVFGLRIFFRRIVGILRLRLIRGTADEEADEEENSEGNGEE